MRKSKDIFDVLNIEPVTLADIGKALVVLLLALAIFLSGYLLNKHQTSELKLMLDDAYSYQTYQNTCIDEQYQTIDDLAKQNKAYASQVATMTVELNNRPKVLQTRAKDTSAPTSGRGAKRTFETTAYGPPDFPQGQLTANGTPVGPGCVAVDPSVIKLGTRLWVYGYSEKYGTAIACDTGGAIKGMIIDLWMPSNEDCIQWGRRQVEVEVIE